TSSTSGFVPGETTNCAPCSITRRTSSADLTVPAPTSASGCERRSAAIAARPALVRSVISAAGRPPAVSASSSGPASSAAFSSTTGTSPSAAMRSRIPEAPATPCKVSARLRQRRMAHEQGPLEGRTAVVTGGGSGIGLATVRRLVAAGARVHAVARRVETMRERLRAELAAGAVAVHGVDVTDLEAVERVIAEIGHESPIGILVCAAGTNIPDRRLEELTEAGWREVVETNLNGVFSCLRA